MPDLGITEILAIASLVAGAAGTGVSVYEGKEQKDAQQALMKSQNNQAQQQALLQKQEALTAAGPNAQAQTGGSLTGQAGQSFADILAGYAGNTGGPGGSSNNPQPSSGTTTPDIASVLAQLQQNGGGGGSSNPFSGGWQPPQQNQPGKFSLSGMQLS